MPTHDPTKFGFCRLIGTLPERRSNSSNQKIAISPLPKILLASVREYFHYILIDCPPSLGNPYVKRPMLWLDSLLVPSSVSIMLSRE